MVYNRRSFSFTLFLQVFVGIRQEFVPVEVSRDCARSCAVHGGMAPELNAHGASGPSRFSGRSSFGPYSRAGRLGFWITRKGFLRLVICISWQASLQAGAFQGRGFWICMSGFQCCEAAIAHKVLLCYFQAQALKRPQTATCSNT